MTYEISDTMPASGYINPSMAASLSLRLGLSLHCCCKLSQTGVATVKKFSIMKFDKNRHQTRHKVLIGKCEGELLRD